MMLHPVRAAVAVCVIAAAPPAQSADLPFTANLSIASQYIFRGLTQTNGKPAIQGGADYSHSGGVYAGTWLSNVSWYKDQNAGTVSAPAALSSPGAAGSPYLPNAANSSSLEWDLYAGFKNPFAGHWNCDLGAIRYRYPGSFDNLGAYRRPDTTEFYGAIGYRWLTAKFSKAISTHSFGANESKGASYLDLSANIPAADSGFSILLHAGRQKYPNRPNPGYFGVSGGNNSFYSYSDFKVGVTKEWQGFSFRAAWTHAGTRATAPDGQTTVYRNAFGTSIGRGRFALTATRTF